MASRSMARTLKRRLLGMPWMPFMEPLAWRDRVARADIAKWKPRPAEPGFPVVRGPVYFAVLRRLHELLRPSLYLEIGTAYGHSLALCDSDFVAIDPEFRLHLSGLQIPGRGFFFSQTSDDFFASGFLGRNDLVPDLGFLDGMHLFEYLLRDFINYEAAAAPGSVAVLHDCLPATAAMEARAWDRKATPQWTGDVWKLVPILRALRPDLRLSLLDASPTGLAVIEGLDPENRTLAAEYDRLVAEYTPLRFADFGAERLLDGAQILPSLAEVARVAERAAAAADKPLAVQA